MNKLDLLEARAAAVSAAIAAEGVIAAHLDQGDWSVRTKADDSPVTDVDVAAEEAIQRVLAEMTPGVAFFGDETGRSPSDADQQLADHLWLVDPIDGTKSFIRGMPFYSTQIALMVQGELVVGVSNAPAYKERVVAVSGHGVTLNEHKVHTRNTSHIEDTYLSTGNLASLARNESGWRSLGELVARVKRVRGYGDFCHYHQLCCGQADLIIESDVNILDIAALSVAVHEAGGVLTDLQGAPIGVETTSVLAAGRLELHQLALSILHTQTTSA